MFLEIFTGLFKSILLIHQYETGLIRLLTIGHCIRMQPFPTTNITTEFASFNNWCGDHISNNDLSTDFATGILPCPFKMQAGYSTDRIIE